MFASLVKEIEDRGTTFLPDIYDADKVKLEGTLKSTREKYNRYSQKCNVLMIFILSEATFTIFSSTGELLPSIGVC